MKRRTRNPIRILAPLLLALTSFGTSELLALGLPGTCGPLSSSFAIDPSNTSTLYAGCPGTNLNGGGGLFKSTDRGATWNAASSGLPAIKPSPNEPWPPNVLVTALAIDPQHARRPGEAAQRQTLTQTLTRQRTLYAVIGASVAVGDGGGAASWHAVNSGLRTLCTSTRWRWTRGI